MRILPDFNLQTFNFLSLHSKYCKIIGLIDSIKEHLEWIKDIFDFPLIADENLLVAKLYNMLIEGKSDNLSYCCQFF